MSTILRLLVLSAFVTSALCHVEINFPLVSLLEVGLTKAHNDVLQGSWNHTEEQQEQGGVCGGGQRVPGVVWGTTNAFVSLSGDEGHRGELCDPTTKNQLTEA